MTFLPWFIVANAILGAYTLASPVPAQGAHALHKRIPGVVYKAGQFEVYARGDPIIDLDNGVVVNFQNTDGNTVVYDKGVPKWQSQVSVPGGCMANNCVLSFQSDGNLVTYANGVATWSTETGGGEGASLEFYESPPYIILYNAANTPIWHTPSPPTAPTPKVNSASGPPADDPPPDDGDNGNDGDGDGAGDSDGDGDGDGNDE